MQTIHASLSDEDYGILYNFVMDGLGWANPAATGILIGRVGPDEWIFSASHDHRLDFATLLILESGREIP